MAVEKEKGCGRQKREGERKGEGEKDRQTHTSMSVGQSSMAVILMLSFLHTGALDFPVSG